MKNKKYFSLLVVFSTLTLLFSCQGLFKKNSSDDHYLRSAASTDLEASEDLHHKTFEKMMNLPKDTDKFKFFSDYLNRQVSFYYIAQKLVQDFDQKLDSVHAKKMNQSDLSIDDVNSFNKARFNNRVAWEYSEKNLHEIKDIYHLISTHANTEGSPYQKSSQALIKEFQKWMDQTWKAGDQTAVIILAQHLNDTHLNLALHAAQLSSASSSAADSIHPLLHSPHQAPVNISLTSKQTSHLKKIKKQNAFIGNYANPHKKTLKLAHQISQKKMKIRTVRPMDHQVENSWNSYLQQRSQESEADFLSHLQIKADENELQNRTPQALDTLYPSPDGKGNVTGNRFPMGKWAMTYDDGPHPVHTQALIDQLIENNVHGTFFWQTQNILKYPSFADQKNKIYSRALHSYTHANLPKLNDQKLDFEINKASDDFEKVVKERPTMFRCPYGACGPSFSKIRTMIAEQNMLHISWNVDTLDWQDKNPDSIFERSKKQIDTYGRGIVLFHDIHTQSVIASDKVIKYLKSKYKIEPLHKLIEESRGEPYYTP